MGVLESNGIIYLIDMIGLDPALLGSLVAFEEYGLICSPVFYFIKQDY